MNNTNNTNRREKIVRLMKSLFKNWITLGKKKNFDSPDSVNVGGRTGGDGAGAPTIHNAITLRPSHTGSVIATKLAITRDTQTQNKSPTNLAGNQRGLT